MGVMFLNGVPIVELGITNSSFLSGVEFDKIEWAGELELDAKVTSFSSFLLVDVITNEVSGARLPLTLEDFFFNGLHSSSDFIETSDFIEMSLMFRSSLFRSFLFSNFILTHFETSLLPKISEGSCVSKGQIHWNRIYN